VVIAAQAANGEPPISAGRTLRQGHATRALVIATVLVGFEGMLGSEATDEECFHAIARRFDVNDEALFVEWQRTAGELTDSRTDQFLYTAFAIIFYIYQLILLCIPPDLQLSSRRVGTILLFSFLIPLALLSNSLGNVTFARSRVDIVGRYIDRCLGPFAVFPRPSAITREGVHLARASWTKYIDSLSMVRSHLLVLSLEEEPVRHGR